MKELLDDLYDSAKEEILPKYGPTLIGKVVGDSSEKASLVRLVKADASSTQCCKGRVRAHLL